GERETEGGGGGGGDRRPARLCGQGSLADDVERTGEDHLPELPAGEGDQGLGHQSIPGGAVLGAQRGEGGARPGRPCPESAQRLLEAATGAGPGGLLAVL